MKALVFEEPRAAAVRELDVPTIAADEVLVRSRNVGKCVVNDGDDHFGFSISGADAEYFVAKASWLHRIPEELSFAQGAFVEPFSVAYNASVAAGGIDASDSVAVIGGGPIGLLCAMAAATMGGSVTLVEPQAHRRTLGLEIGATRV